MKNGWQTKRLGDVLEVQNGYAFDSEGFNPTKGMPLIRIRSLKPRTETETRFDGDYDKKYVVKAGDLLIGMDGEFGCYEWKGEPALLNQRVCRLQGFSGELVPRFLFYGVNDYLKAIEDVTGFATVKHISSKQVLGIEFPVPPLREQQRIVGLLDEAFAGIATAEATAEQNLQNARALFESHLQSVFTQRGPGWVEKPLGECFRLKSGDSMISKAMIAGPFPVYGGNGIAGMHNEFNLSGGNVIIGRVGALCGNARHVTEKIWLTDNAFRLVDFSCEFDNAFLAYLLNYKNLRTLARQTAQPVISNSSLKDLALTFPALPEQRRIASQLEDLSAETQRLASLYERKLAALEALKKSLLHQAFSGAL